MLPVKVLSHPRKHKIVLRGNWSSPTMIKLMQNWTVMVRAPWAALQQMNLQVIPPCLIMSLKEEVLVHTVMKAIVRWKRLLWKHHFPILLKVFCSLLKLDFKLFSWKLPVCVRVGYNNEESNSQADMFAMSPSPPPNKAATKDPKRKNETNQHKQPPPPMPAEVIY